MGRLPLDDEGVRRLVGDFIRIYEARFGEGAAFEAAGIEITTFRVTARAPVRGWRLAAPRGGGGASPAGVREVFRDRA